MEIRLHFNSNKVLYNFILFFQCVRVMTQSMRTLQYVSHFKYYNHIQCHYNYRNCLYNLIIHICMSSSRNSRSQTYKSQIFVRKATAQVQPIRIDLFSSGQDLLDVLAEELGEDLTAYNVMFGTQQVFPLCACKNKRFTVLFLSISWIKKISPVRHPLAFRIRTAVFFQSIKNACNVFQLSGVIENKFVSWYLDKLSGFNLVYNFYHVSFTCAKYFVFVQSRMFVDWNKVVNLMCL